MAFTFVYPGDLKDFAENPFDIETHWGKPFAASVRNVMEERDALQDALAWLEGHEPELVDQAKAKFGIR